VDEAVRLRELCPFIREFHLDSQVRTPEHRYHWARWILPRW
jgi:hypothetical protein